MEYLLLIAFVFLMLFAIMIVAYTQSTSLSSDVTAEQVQKVGNQIVDAVNIAYYAGPPTKKTISVYFPENVDAATVADQSIVFLVQSNAGKSEYAITAASNMTGTLQHFAGLHTITITALDTVVNISDR